MSLLLIVVGTLSCFSYNINGLKVHASTTKDVLIPITGRWGAAGFSNGRSVGMYNQTTSTFIFPNSYTFQYGTPNSGLIPIAGDWTNKGYDSVGLYNPATGQFFLKNSNTTGFADITFTFGNPNMIPIAGDWLGTGYYGVGVYNPANGQFALKYSNTTGYADNTFTFGSPNMLPVVGKWETGLNGAPKLNDTIGVYNPANGQYFLRNSNTTGYADKTITFIPNVSLNSVGGYPYYQPLRGNYEREDGKTTPLLYSYINSTFYIRYSMISGPEEYKFTFLY